VGFVGGVGQVEGYFWERGATSASKIVQNCCAFLPCCQFLAAVLVEDVCKVMCRYF